MAIIKNDIILQEVQEKLQKNEITEADILSVTELDLHRRQ